MISHSSVLLLNLTLNVDKVYKSGIAVSNNWLIYVTANEEVKENTQKGQRYWGAGEINKEKSNLWVVERNKKNWGGSGWQRIGEGNHV